ncbi:MAG: hypothetical protein H0Z19_06985 [Archaeoglobus sp.]|uniref:DUF6206 family protein n=1 Tax=Archaeoglobus sp. TaxID=1872626 RepID=UPI001DE2980C|nr:DUF6206 family protein [Archaeoglobus sp.]MBO8180210.1 hypothetical protein [Archaeoglobus sp.]
MQEKLDPSRICNNIIKEMEREDAIELFSKVLDEIYRVEEFNRRKKEEGVEIGLDGQLSNWALYDRMVYFDTSTPMVRQDGRDLLDTDIFLRACPPGVRVLLKKFFLQDILDRYYDFRMILLDLIANLFKEGRRDLVQPFINHANEYLMATGNSYEPMTYKEIEKYYREDAFIWSLYLNLRKIHRFIVTKILFGRYEFILPGRIKRYQTKN